LSVGGDLQKYLFWENSNFFQQISDDNFDENYQEIMFEIEDFWRTGEA
jgi:hypothetical protein